MLVRNQPCSGFSLLEMLIIVALIAILVQLAVPNYQDRVVKVHRLGAKTALMQAQISLEDCYIDKQDFLACTLLDHGDYLLSLQASQHTYVLSLRPKPGTIGAQDPECYYWQVDEKNDWQGCI